MEQALEQKRLEKLLLALEFVSKTYNQEYGEKMRDYAQLRVKYYVIYNPEYSRRDKHEPWEVYQLVRERYQLQQGEPFWIPEIGLGIGRVQGELGGIQREWLAWYDQAGTPYPLPHELIRQQERQLRQERQRAERLADYVRSLGLDPDDLPDLQGFPAR